MFRPPNSYAPSPLPRFLLLAPLSVDSVPSVLKAPSNTSSVLPSAPSLFSLFCTKSQKLTPSLSDPYALFKKECFANFFTINNFRTLLQYTRGVPTSSAQRLPMFSTVASLRTHTNTRNPFLYNRLLHSSLFTHILSLPPVFSPPPTGAQLPPNTETPCQLPPSCIDSSGARIVPPNRRLEASTQ
jgi:hypothetical protein